MLRPYHQLCGMSLDNCAICNAPLKKRGGWKKVDGPDGDEVKVCDTHPTPEKKE